MNPNKMNPQVQRIVIKHWSPILDVQFSRINPSILYAITKNAELLKINWKENTILSSTSLPKELLVWEKAIQIKCSSEDTYLAIVNEKGSEGYVWNIAEEKIQLLLNRKDYHSEQTNFPLLFYKHYLVHPTDWNHLEITDLKKNKLITKRNTNVYKKDGDNSGYLDYFYGELHLSPDGTFLLSSGWVWGPAAVFKFIDFQSWLHHNKAEPEKKEKLKSSSYGIMSYYWDRAVCWLSNHEIAFLFDPREEGLDEEDCKDLQIKKDESCILIYDRITNDVTENILGIDFPKNDHFEATSDCKLFYLNNKLILSSLSEGLKIIDRESGKIELEDGNISLSHRVQNSNCFYSLKENNCIDIVHIL